MSKTKTDTSVNYDKIYELQNSGDFRNYKKITGNRLYEYRHSLGLSRDKFAELCGISPSFLSDVERGVKTITIVTLYKICKIFNVSADYFVLGNEKEYQNDIALEILNNFSNEEKDMVISILSEIRQLLDLRKKP